MSSRRVRNHSNVFKHYRGVGRWGTGYNKRNTVTQIKRFRSILLRVANAVQQNV